MGATRRTEGRLQSPVLKIWFGPPNADFWSVWSSQKAQIQPTTKVRILCFEWKRICFQTLNFLLQYDLTLLFSSSSCFLSCLVPSAL